MNKCGWLVGWLNNKPTRPSQLTTSLYTRKSGWDGMGCRIPEHPPRVLCAHGHVCMMLIHTRLTLALPVATRAGMVLLHRQLDAAGPENVVLLRRLLLLLLMVLMVGKGLMRRVLARVRVPSLLVLMLMVLRHWHWQRQGRQRGVLLGVVGRRIGKHGRRCLRARGSRARRALRLR